MSIPPPVTLALALWLLWSILTWWVHSVGFRQGELGICSAKRFVQVYARLLHRMRIEGREHIPTCKTPGPLLVVANHTAGVDPLLIQAACPFEIRWIMGEDMRIEAANPLWRWLGIIFVDRFGGKGSGLREAITWAKRGGVIGIFPEGGLERPAQMVRPFEPGVGLLASRTKASILCFVVEGTPQVDPAWASLWSRGRVKLRAMPIIHPAQEGLRARDASKWLRERYLQWTGWPANDRELSSSEEQTAHEALST